MPAMEMDQREATLLRWLKPLGGRVERDEALMEIETDKVTVAIEAPGAGVLGKILAQPGDVVAVGTVVALIFGEDELVNESLAPTAPPPPADTSAGDGGSGTGPLSGLPTEDGEVQLSESQKITAERITNSYRDAPHIAIRRMVNLLALTRILAGDDSEPAARTVLSAVLKSCANTLARY